MKKILILIILILLPLASRAENERDYVRKGNSQFKSKKYNDAEINYRKSLQKNNKSLKGAFNLGDALYKQQQYDKAAEQFAELSTRDMDQKTASQVYHNLGNSYLQNKKYNESIEAYKQALRSNPKDVETKYNLEYAKRMIQVEQQKQQQKQNKQDQKQDKQDKKDQKQQQQQQNQDQNKQDQKQQQQPQQKISKQDAERMLQALANEEKNVKNKLKKKAAVAGKKKVEKDW